MKKAKFSLSNLLIMGDVPMTQKAFFAKHLSLMLKSGLTILDALAICVQSTDGKFKKILKRIYFSVQSGNSLSSALAEFPKVFSGFFINAVFAGESSGTLEENLNYISEYLNKEKIIRGKIKAAMVYPIVVGIAALGVGMSLAFFVLPKIADLFSTLRIELPLSTRMLIAFSSFTQAHGIVFSVCLAGGIILFGWLVKQRFAKPITHWIFLRLPIIKNIVRYANLSRFCRTLYLLLKSGVNIDSALSITKETTTNYYYKRSLIKISRRIHQGGRLSENLASYEWLFPIIAVKMIKVGEESGNLEETLTYLSDFYQEEVDTSIKALSTAIEPILLIIIGLVVGILAMSIITPIYKITGNISQ